MAQSKLTVINLRGTSGCGKTTIVKNVLAHGSWNKWQDNKGRILGYYDKNLNWAIVGSYENVCGGCDTIKTQKEIEERIWFFLQAGYNVLFEGLLTSTLSSRWAEFSKRISHCANTLFYYVDTPIEVCLQRVQSRREQRGATKPFNPNNTINRVKAIEGTFTNLTKAGCYCLKGSQEEIMTNLYNWFGIGGTCV